MQEHDGRQHFNITERLEDLRREHEALRWEGSFRDYFELVAQNPKIAQLSHGRVNDMVHAANCSDDLAKAPNVEVLMPWKGVELREMAMQRVRDFLIRHTP